MSSESCFRLYCYDRCAWYFAHYNSPARIRCKRQVRGSRLDDTSACSVSARLFDFSHELLGKAGNRGKIAGFGLGR